MVKHIATVAGIGLAFAFVAVFFIGRVESKHITEVAPKVGMSHDELLAVGPRVASQAGVTLGTSRRVVYLLACSGLATRQTLEEQATLASMKALKESLTDREAVGAVLSARVAGAGISSLKGC